MSGYFSMGNDLRDHWFKIGRVEVGSTLLTVGAVVLAWIASVIAPNLPAVLLFTTAELLGGEVWRAFTWPFAEQIGLWGVLSLFFFWIFGTELEQQLGKNKMAVLLLGIWASLTVSAAALGLLLSNFAVLMGIGLIQFVVLLLWIAENPRRPFFFAIPAWVVGAVLVALQVLQLIAARNLVALLSMLLGFALVAVLARSQGLLRDYDWIPGRSTPKPGKPGKPTRAAREQAKRQAARAKDDDRLNELLDQISAKGMDSLTPAQRRELMKLRNRR
ncbi:MULTISPECIES: hypothetical protein [unclassified Luteococcus]|uniref:hypothetical protein n=1 Tax=unclassified Luteococcus TaxID=2639923 RepID=UPI00313DAE0B